MSTSLATIEKKDLFAFIKSPPVVYLCAEFAVDQKLPIYAGGLGILAGDVLGQANEDGRNYIGVGLMYHKGYLRQAISKEANIFEADSLDITASKLKLLVDGGVPVQLTVPIHARQVQIKIWVYTVGSVPLLLLDTDVEGNEAQDVNLCERLYYGDKEHRFKQEMILGIGGLRAINTLGIEPKLYHLNEGHSALMLFEHARLICERNKTSNYQEVLENITDVVFTNHTLVPAGNDVFSKDLVISYLASFALEFPIDPAVLTHFGLIQDSSLFSPTMLALRLATVSQAVSKLHARKALESWPDHPLVPVTNGVRQKYWQAEELATVDTSNDTQLWQAHHKRKQAFLSYIKELTGFEWGEGDLIISWARRLANYKRPLLLFEQEERLHSIISNAKVPLRFLFSGKPHAHDTAAQENLQKLLDYVGKYNGSIVYLQNYSIEIGKLITSGSDLLLNTPVRGYEACGTSGMKASLNGVLLATTLDGWTDEVNWDGIGWVLRDDDTANSVYETIESSIIPEYTEHNAEGIPLKWTTRMRKAMNEASSRFTAKHMLDELERTVYSQVKKATIE